MRKIVFTLITVFALAIVTISVKAQDKFAPYPGGTYSYTLDIALANISDATLTASGLTSGTSTISNISPSLTNIPASTTSITFDVTYSDNATGTCRIEFVITDQSSNCNNTIYVDIPVSSIPTYTLDIVASITETCQTRTGASDNTPDALGDGSEANSFTFTVTPDIQGVPTTYSYAYTINLPSNAVLDAFDNGSGGVAAYSSGVVTYSNVTSHSADVFTVTFNTTTGEDTQALIASIVAGASSTLTLQTADGGGTYEATIASGGNSSQTVTVGSVPEIGSFQ